MEVDDESGQGMEEGLRLEMNNPDPEEREEDDDSDLES